VVDKRTVLYGCNLLVSIIAVIAAELPTDINQIPDIYGVLLLLKVFNYSVERLG